MELTEVDLGSEDPGAGRSGSEPEPARGGVSSSADSVAEEEEEEGEGDAAGSRRASRASSLVSGLLVELYSVGRPRHRDSVDSSTEASAGSDAFPGGRGSSAESRFLQELQRRPNQRHQRTYLAQKGKDGRVAGSPLPTGLAPPASSTVLGQVGTGAALFAPCLVSFLSACRLRVQAAARPENRRATQLRAKGSGPKRMPALQWPAKRWASSL